jgi:glycine/D-amino acid oxidase-like deaminating enzyme/nitrite reductase/ring-hydroxylating ferredoxin subunit
MGLVGCVNPSDGMPLRDPARMDTTPLWLAEPGPTYPALQGDLETEALIIGGGITGVTTAYLLKQAGRKVVLLERGAIGEGESGHTTAHLTKVTDRRLSELVRDFGRDHAQAVWDAGQSAVEEIGVRVRDERIECGWRGVPGFLFAALGEDAAKAADDLHREAHLAAELGFDADFVDRAPVVGRPAVRYPNQAEFHPIRYLRALAARIPGDGSYVFEHSEAGEFSDQRHVTINGYPVSYEHCVVATHVPLQARSATLPAMFLQTKLAAYSTYAVGGPVPHRKYPRALFWDTADPYLYIRIQEGEHDDYVIVGGADHKTGQGDPEECYERLRHTARSFVPDATFDRRWSGQVIETPDGLPYIGETGAGEFVATGFAGNGMTFGTLAALMARDWVLGRKNPWRELFSPRRKKLSGAWDYLRENKDYPCYLAKRLLAAADTASLDDVPRGEGRIVRLDGRKAAVHRRDDGSLCIHSAVCPHLGCIVEWNAAEKTWDCPCHGSRFQATGEVIAGPAESPLSAKAS